MHRRQSDDPDQKTSSILVHNICRDSPELKEVLAKMGA